SLLLQRVCVLLVREFYKTRGVRQHIPQDLQLAHICNTIILDNLLFVPYCYTTQSFIFARYKCMVFHLAFVFVINLDISTFISFGTFSVCIFCCVGFECLYFSMSKFFYYILEWLMRIQSNPSLGMINECY